MVTNSDFVEIAGIDLFLFFSSIETRSLLSVSGPNEIEFAVSSKNY